MTDTLPYALCEDGFDETVWAVRATGGITRGQARAQITRAREVPFTTGSLKVAWLKPDPDTSYVISAAPHEPGATPYWCYAGP
jgi:hypothetical protein